jgi:hypothetical protein
MRTNMNLLFYLKKRSNYQSGLVAIYLRFNVNGGRAETSTGKTCEPSRWNTQAGRASGTKEEIRKLNAYLDGLQAQAQELFRNMQIREEVLTAENVKNRFTGKEEKARTLVAVFEDHNQKMESLSGRSSKRALCSVIKPA